LQSGRFFHVAVLFVVLLLCNVPLIQAQAQASSITKVLICSQVNGYGDYVERSSSINLGEVFYVYVEANVPGTWSSNSQYYLKMQFTLDIADPVGMTTYSDKSKVLEQYVDPSSYTSEWYWSDPVNSSKLVNYINGNYQIKAGLEDFAENTNTSASATFSLQGGFPTETVYTINDSVVLTNEMTSNSAQVQMLRLVEIPNVGSYQTVLDGPRTNIQPQGVTYDDYGNKYILFTGITIAPGSSMTVAATYTVSIKFSKIIGAGSIPLSSLQHLPQENQQYLQPTPYIDSDNPIFTGIANSFKQQSGDVLQLIYRLHNFTAAHLAYDRAAISDSRLRSTYGLDSASTTYIKGIGICTNFSRLLVALLRAAGIPARTVSGWGFLSMLPGVTYSDTISHMWVEAYIPWEGWVPIEPQVPQTLGYSLGSHILFDFSSLERNVSTEGYNDTISPYQFWSWTAQQITSSESFSHITQLSYDSTPSSQYESVTAPTITASLTSISSITAGTTQTGPASVVELALGFLILALPFIVVIAIIGLVVRHRRRRGLPVRSVQSSISSYPTIPTIETPSGIKYCTICGFRLRQNAAFCVKCGAKQGYRRLGS